MPYFKLTVNFYDESSDAFNCALLHGDCENICSLPAIVVAQLTGEFGEPDDFIGKTYDMVHPEDYDNVI